jgi:pimeloyl-ACP methyl ester carboxylesterase
MVGLGFGGWIAAEIATMRPKGLGRLVLATPMGAKPEDGYVYDQFLVNTEAYVRHAFLNQTKFDHIYGAEPDIEQLMAWEADRMMTSRVGWKPYMYNSTLPGLLAGVREPTLVLGADNDTIVPAGCAVALQQSIPGAELRIIRDSGHAVELEQHEAFVSAVLSFLRAPERSEREA